MQKLYENFYTRSNYSNRAVIYVNHTKIFFTQKFLSQNILHENKANYSICNSYTMGKSALPDIYARAQGPQA